MLDQINKTRSSYYTGWLYCVLKFKTTHHILIYRKVNCSKFNISIHDKCLVLNITNMKYKFYLTKSYEEQKKFVL